MFMLRDNGFQKHQKNTFSFLFMLPRFQVKGSKSAIFIRFFLCPTNFPLPQKTTIFDETGNTFR